MKAPENRGFREHWERVGKARTDYGTEGRLSPRATSQLGSLESDRQRGLARVLSLQLHFDLMILPIIFQEDHLVWLFDTVDGDAFHGVARFGLQDGDVE